MHLQASPGVAGSGFPPLTGRSVAGYGDCPSGTAAIPDAKVGNGPIGTPGISMPFMPIAHPSPDRGRYRSARRLLLGSPPRQFRGVRSGKRIFRRRSLRSRFVFDPPPVPLLGEAGREKEEKGIARASAAPVGRGRHGLASNAIMPALWRYQHCHRALPYAAASPPAAPSGPPLSETTHRLRCLLNQPFD